MNMKVRVIEINYLKKYLNRIRPHLKDITNDLKKCDT